MVASETVKTGEMFSTKGSLCPFPAGKGAKRGWQFVCFPRVGRVKGGKHPPQGLWKKDWESDFLEEFGELVKRKFDGLIREVYMKLQKDRKALFHFNIVRKTLEG